MGIELTINVKLLWGGSNLAFNLCVMRGTIQLVSLRMDIAYEEYAEVRVFMRGYSDVTYLLNLKQLQSSVCVFKHFVV